MKVDCNEKGKKKEDDDKKKDSANATAEPDEWVFTTTFIGQTSSQEPNSCKGLEVDIYNSGASSHMSPDRHWFTKFRETPPYPIAAADKAIFNATGIGDMQIAIPNSRVTNHVTIKDVLYCKDLAFTLISLPKCDKAGFTVLICDKHCMICDPKGTTIGRIPLVGDLYKVEHNQPADYATMAHKTLSIDEVHQQLGYISLWYINVRFLHFTNFLTIHQKNLNQICIINGVLSDRYECYSKEYSCLANYGHTHACDNYFTKCT